MCVWLAQTPGMTMGEQPLRVVFLCNEYPPLPHGGIGVFVADSARRLVSAGHEAVVVGVSHHVAERIDEERNGVRVVVLPPSQSRALDAFGTARAVRRELGRWIDHPRVVVEGSELSLWAVPAKWVDRSIARLHGGHRFFAEAEGRKPKLFRAAIERRSLRRASQIVGVSQYVVDRTADLVGLDARSIGVIPNGVDVDAFHPAASPEPDTIAFVGTLCEKKGLRYLVRAIDTLHRDGRPVRLVVAGRDLGSLNGKASFLDEVLDEVSPSVREAVEYLGPVAHEGMPAVYARASIIALPSLMEAQGIAWLEAMACGRAILASNRGPGPEVIEDGVSGLLRDPTDVDQIANGLRTLLDEPALATRIGHGARQRVLDHFSLERTTAANLALYREVADRARS